MAANGVKAVTEGAKVASEVVKAGRLQRFGKYVKEKIDNITIDYKLAAQEVVQDFRDGSIKAAVYLAGLCGAGVMIAFNPTEADLEDTMMQHCHELSLVGGLIRNKESNDFIDGLRSAHREKRLHHTSLGLCSLVWVSEHRDELDLYEAKCKHTNLPWYQWHKQIVDIGIIGKYIKMTRKMEDYDINEDEWKDTKST